MKKKKKKSFFQGFIDFVVGSGKDVLFDALQEKVSETIDGAEEKLERAIKKILSIVTVFSVIFIGFIFVLVGLSKYLSEAVSGFKFGIGYIVVGAILIMLALLFRIAANSSRS